MAKNLVKECFVLEEERGQWSVLQEGLRAVFLILCGGFMYVMLLYIDCR